MFLRATLLILALASPASAQDYPDYTSTTVNDFADVLTTEQEAGLQSDLQSLRDSHGVEFTVVTMRSMRDYGHTGEIEPFATELFNRWGVGDATRNDGIMLLVAVEDRQMRIELGAGYSLFWNGRAQHVIDDVILPDFRRDAYAEGIIDGSNAVIALVHKFVAPPDASWLTRTGYGLRSVIAVPLTWIVAVIGVLGGTPLYAWRRARKRPRLCPRDGTRMVLLDEGSEDLHLDLGKQTEERVRSVEHDVWQCQTCGTVTVEGYRKWFSRYGACRECGYRTVTGYDRTIVHATETSTGVAETTCDCAHCGAHYITSRTIPMRTRTSSSSSGGSSSFGGGSSRGGGASGRW